MGRFLKILSASAAATLLAPSCAPTSIDGFIRRTTSIANDHIMYVRADPETFGHKRLAALAGAYPDLGIFLQQKGYPDFVAETNKSGNRYLILYFLEDREAFASRSGAGSSRLVEFSGPYPVTNSEYATLEELRKKASSTGEERHRGFANARG